MSGLRCALVVIALASLSGCLLPDFQNGPEPTPNEPQDASVLPDAQDEWLPQEDVVSEPDVEVQPDVVDEPDAEPIPDVIEAEAGFCEVNPDGTVCGSGDACHERICVAGACVLAELPNGIECAPAPNACHQPGRCNAGVCGNPVARPDGYNWDASDTWKRCCGAQALRMDTNANCGVCGIKCNTGDGQSCKLNPVNDKYYCEGCGASAACWSGCCSNSYGQPYRCAASDCEGHCIACPAGSSCIATPGQASLVCAYE